MARCDSVQISLKPLDVVRCFCAKHLGLVGDIFGPLGDTISGGAVGVSVGNSRRISTALGAGVVGCWAAWRCCVSTICTMNDVLYSGLTALNAASSGQGETDNFGSVAGVWRKGFLAADLNAALGAGRLDLPRARPPDRARVV